MYQPLVPCVHCKRHLRASENECPFCGGALVNSARRIAPDTTRRMTRAAAFVFGAAVTVTACGSDVETQRDDDDGAGGVGANDVGGSGTLYGAPGGFGGSGANDAGGFAAMYGAPAPVATPPAAPAATAAASGGGMAEYGAPPPPIRDIARASEALRMLP